MTTEQVLAFAPGPLLDRAVHQIALGKVGKAPRYSRENKSAAELIEQLPIYAARMSMSTPDYNPDKPYLGGVLEWVESMKLFCTVSRVRCSTLPIAICKAALLYAIMPKERAPTSLVNAGVPKLGSQLAPKQLDPMPERTMTTKLPEMPQIPEGKPL